MTPLVDTGVFPPFNTLVHVLVHFKANRIVFAMGKGRENVGNRDKAHGQRSDELTLSS
jgi:hypothetical protein